MIFYNFLRKDKLINTLLSVGLFLPIGGTLFIVLSFLYNKFSLPRKAVVFLIFYFLYTGITFLFSLDFSLFADIFRLALMFSFWYGLTTVRVINFLRVLRYIFFTLFLFQVLFLAEYLRSHFPNLNESVSWIILETGGIIQLYNQTTIANLFFLNGIILMYLFNISFYQKLFLFIIVLVNIVVLSKSIFLISIIISFFFVYLLKLSIKFYFIVPVAFISLFLLSGQYLDDAFLDVLLNYRGRIWYVHYCDFMNATFWRKMFGFGTSYEAYSSVPFTNDVDFHHTSSHSAYLRVLLQKGIVGVFFMIWYLWLIFFEFLKLDQLPRVLSFYFWVMTLVAISDGSIMYKLNDIYFYSMFIVIIVTFEYFKKNEVTDVRLCT